MRGNGQCDPQCMVEGCGFDTAKDGPSDCSDVLPSKRHFEAWIVSQKLAVPMNACLPACLPACSRARLLPWYGRTKALYPPPVLPSNALHMHTPQLPLTCVPPSWAQKSKNTGDGPLYYDALYPSGSGSAEGSPGSPTVRR